MTSASFSAFARTVDDEDDQDTVRFFRANDDEPLVSVSVLVSITVGTVGVEEEDGNDDDVSGPR